MTRKIGRKLGVFGTLFCCLGLTQTGPCPFGSPCRNFDANDDDACTVDTCEVVDGAATAIHTPVACPDQVCNPADGECIDCLTDDDCDQGYCSEAGGNVCVECLIDGQCDDSSDCTGDTCVNETCTHENLADGTANPAVFVDPSDATNCTNEVLDSDDEIVQFDPVAKSIIWVADGTAYQEGQWDVNGVLLAGGGFTVAFGTKNGVNYAYFTETASATLCDIAVQGGQLYISPTSLTVPHD